MQNDSLKLKDTENQSRAPSGFLNFDFCSLRSELKGGYAVLTTTVLVVIVSLALISGFTFFVFQEVRITRNFAHSIDAHYVSEGGIEDGLYRVLSGKQLTSAETLKVGRGTTTILYTISGQTRTIRSEGKREAFQQNLETVLDTTKSGTNFIYGVQAGDGGIEMSNTAKIIGSVYSNGNIIGEDSPVITGDAFAASTSRIEVVTVNGHARANLIRNNTVGKNASSTTNLDNVIVGANAYANSLIASTITGDAYFMTKDGATTILGAQFPGTPPPSILPKLPMPIPDSQIDQWEAEAALGGIHTSPCPYVLSSGTTNLGPKKIACDMDIKNTAIVNLTGTLWVAGNLTIQNSAVVRLDPSYGANSGLIIVDDPANRSSKGILEVKNSAQILGSGTTGSYVMLVSRNNSAESGGNTDAIEVQNNSSAPIYYAPHGSIEIHNNANLKEVTAYKLEIRNNATVTYESGLQDVKFSSGPSGGYYDVRYWKEVE